MLTKKEARLISQYLALQFPWLGTDGEGEECPGGADVIDQLEQISVALGEVIKGL